ncbi:MAG: type II toxin-antitoxin system prevent-host-death family antitoxin [Acidobacteriota bacterium]
MKKTANVAELKNNISAYLREVQRGSEVIVSVRNRPVAKLVPINFDDDYDAEEVELIAKGILRPPQIDERVPDSFWEEDLPYVPGNRAIEVLLEERYGED